MKKYVLIAGVNGAGKSTLYETTGTLKGMNRINTDEIVKEIGDWRKFSDVVKAGKIAIRLVKENFAKGSSFCQETTLCGHLAMKNVHEAKMFGYMIELHYVGVDSVEIAKRRVKYRVRKGGHDIPEKDIEKRYYESFVNLKEILNECDLAVFYDNTEEFRRFAVYKNGENVFLATKIPLWFQKNVLERTK